MKGADCISLEQAPLKRLHRNMRAVDDPAVFGGGRTRRSLCVTLLPTARPLKLEFLKSISAIAPDDIRNKGFRFAPIGCVSRFREASPKRATGRAVRQILPVANVLWFAKYYRLPMFCWHQDVLRQDGAPYVASASNNALQGNELWNTTAGLLGDFCPRLACFVDGQPQLNDDADCEWKPWDSA